ncbi:hypothetical protein [Pseudomonas phage Achelous]|uniref:Uncharacterized protein n=1 Tax=Pseudomonas phage Achelous TaxID=2163982 RepID=A0A2S1GMX1_9CAUD|nr:hypothetical protein HOT10_gp47 [Pseudomonas phage Achelous]AWD90724.1 hypothetical protein [Pseudomonas phage Achelous]
MRWSVVVTILAVLLGALSWHQGNVLRDTKKDLVDTRRELEATKAKVKQIQVNTSKAQATAQGNRVKTKEVLDATPEFRDTPVPQPVVDSLCKILRCN